MAPTAIQDREVATLPLVVETARSESRYVPETVYLTATDPDSSNQEYTRLMVSLEDHNHGEDILVDLRTNNDRFAFVCKAIRSHFNRHHHIVESWPPEFDTEF